MSTSKSHFEDVAKLINFVLENDIRTMRSIGERQAREAAERTLLSLATGLCRLYVRGNHKFDRPRFMAACAGKELRR